MNFNICNLFVHRILIFSLRSLTLAEWFFMLRDGTEMKDFAESVAKINYHYSGSLKLCQDHGRFRSLSVQCRSDPSL